MGDFNPPPTDVWHPPPLEAGDIDACYTIMGETQYTLEKTDKGPFDHIVIRDDEFIDSLQGIWYEWSMDKSKGFPLKIDGNMISWTGRPEAFHVVSYRHDPESVYIVPEDLTQGNFSGYTSVQVKDDMLTSTMIVSDMSIPLSVFAREDMLDKIKVPEAAKRPAVNTICRVEPDPGMAGMLMGAPMMNTSFIGMKSIQPQAAAAPEDGSSAFPKYCPECGYKLPEQKIKFCPQCGQKCGTSDD